MATSLIGPPAPLPLGPLGPGAVTQHQAAGRHRVRDRAVATAAAADQRQLDGVAFCGMDMRKGHARQSRSGGKLAGGFDEITT